jgi:hypothetical protein
MATERTALFLRGMPTRLVREAKAVAARRGSTLAAVVSDALERSLHEGPGDSEGASELRDAMRWYEENRSRLLSRYRGRYVAILERKVVDHDRAFEPLAERVFARWGVRPIFMPRVQEGERLARIRSPRVAR